MTSKKNKTLKALLAALAIGAGAQTTPPAGTVQVSTSVKATAGADPATALICVAVPTHDQEKDQITVTCTSGPDTVLTSTATRTASALQGIVVDAHLADNAVTWLFKKDSTAGWLWQVAANGVYKEGHFE